ncbi:hypothetical protein Sipo8835_16520 [Streptomyces ipomoeae]|jgi:hypothetical protein|uniref:Uncharacterized protein n=1 Tax=Streptomyces ipomoeae TaxID=103232 RepID=A0A540QEK2_9ACTN|nr:hypothetical protein [Streptomyces ipomoeae]MDX2827141.1 hypothetical protein [Streptomyces ipomoeae]MDX2879756.1 hypothetical protein [Streptomyces ipomoeae]MDX2935620.1 hypothetical protein [Streptomyces ipomoeae]TQE18422.1 hypothetical protein SipoB123_34405 [Streptomyces ipomoeae]TQE31424.1 hypothetical protein Sipo7851_25735 [Streptomyces ipomoeae]
MASDDGQGRAPAPEDLGTAAKGWHSVQLAVLGFVGLCGVLKDSGPAGVPRDIQAVAGVLALSSLALACCAVFLVGSAAWPLYRTGSRPADPRRTSRALRTGIALTFTAVALLALSAATSWWPVSGEGALRGLVRVSTGGGAVCGPLHESGDGFLNVRVDDHVVAVPLGEITTMRPVPSCG